MYYLAIFLGGGFGSLCRYFVSSASKNVFGTKGLPYGTLISNILACLLLAVIVFLLKDKLNNYPLLTPLLLIGFCGGFSTFSTFSYETIELINSKMYLLAVINVLISIGVCFSILYYLSKQQG